ncbi:MAG: hypothetical protein VB959_17895, partial [Rhodospirillales bacterium]
MSNKVICVIVDGLRYQTRAANSPLRLGLDVRAKPRSWRSHTCRRISRFCLLLVIFLLGPSFVQAQQAQQARPNPVVSVQELENLASTIEDKVARDKLVSNIRALLAVKKQAQPEQPVESTGARLIADLLANVRQVSRQMLAAAETFGDLPNLAASIQKGMTDSNTRQQWLGLIIKVALILIAAGFGEYLTRLLLHRPRRKLEERAADTFWVRLSLLAGRTFLDIVPLAVFAAVAYVVVPFMQPTAQAQVMALTLINAYLIVCTILAVVRMLLAPAVESLRVLLLSNMSANYLFIWTRRLTGFSVFGFFFAEAALLLGLPASGHAALLRLLGLIITGLVVVFFLQNRAPVATWIRGDGKVLPTGGLRNRLADIWHVLAGIYAVAIFAVWALGMTGGFEYLARASAYTAAILIATRLFATGLDRAVVKGVAIR